MKTFLFLSLMVVSALLHAGTEDCSQLVNDHVIRVDHSERLINSLIREKAEEVSQFNIHKLQLDLTNRFNHLKEIITAFKEEDRCANSYLGDAVILYDLVAFGSKALNDDKMRKIIFHLVKVPRYELTDLRTLYWKYTSVVYIKNFETELSVNSITLPENLVRNYSINLGRFSNGKDLSVRVATKVVGTAANLWGKLSDKTKWREGRLKDNAEVITTLRGNLKPFDMIFEKRTYVLSNYTIPGHWGHVAVWLGTKEELIESGVWDKNFFAPFRPFIEKGKNIIEMRKKGIQFVSLEDFTNLDEIAVTRIKGIEKNSFNIYMSFAEILDATYDFGFDVYTLDQITCSEMITFSFGDIRWPALKTLLNVSVRPDDIAVLSLYEDSPEEFVLYFKGTKEGYVQKSLDDWKSLFKLKNNNPVYTSQTLSAPEM